MAHYSLPNDEMEKRRQQRRNSRQTQTYNAFLKDLCAAGRFSEELAEKAAVSVLCTLKQRLMPDEAKDLEAQLPMRLQNLVYQSETSWSSAPVKFGHDEFVSRVAEDLGMQPSEAEPVIRSVLRCFQDHVSEGEIKQVIAQLPPRLRELWHS